jgi:hypothetical protein
MARKAEVIKGGFKTTLATSLRDYEVTLVNAHRIIVQAHLHDGGRGKDRLLSFITIGSDGALGISNSIHGDAWLKIKNVTPAARREAFEKLCAAERQTAA